jgi:pimeloyl-ACP methyl ester carboxylesterase
MFIRHIMTDRVLGEHMLGLVVAVVVAVLALGFAGLVLFARRTARRVERAVPPLGRFVEVGGAKLHYVDRGEGPPVVMIHGIGANLRHYAHTILDEVAKTNRVIAIDRPGCGYSDRPAGADNSTRTQAAIIQKALDRLDIADPLIVGHSLGGSVALAHALLHPGKARGYVLIAPLAAPPEKKPPFDRWYIPSPLRQRLIAWTIGVPMAIKYGPRITAFVFAPQTPPDDFGTRSGALLGLRPKAIINNFRDAVASPVTVEEMYLRYGEIHAPVYCLFGIEDQVLDVELNLAPLASMHSAEIRLIDGAGHMLLHVAPQAVIDAIGKLEALTTHQPRRLHSFNASLVSSSGA